MATGKSAPGDTEQGDAAPTARRTTAGYAILGQTVGPFRILSRLGEGGMGQVFLAEHQLIGRKAAIKVLAKEVSGSEDVVSRFFTEARAVNDIRHPNIVEVTDFGTVGNQPYIVMEYLEGETLSDRLARVNVLDEPAAVHITAQIASALGAAHDRQMVHRDLKPANIFLRNHPDYPDFVKVLDFGIAKLLANEFKVTHKTETGALMGTPAYMSPEQCLGDLSLDHRSDIYSLGVVLYLMLTGRLPFVTQSLGRMMLCHVHEAPEPLVAVNPRVSRLMNAVVMKTLEKKPEHRFSSMRELREALVTVVTGRTPLLPGSAAARPSDLTPKPVALPARPSPPVAGARADRDADDDITSAPPETMKARLVRILEGRLAEEKLELPSLSPRSLRCLEVLRDPKFAFSTVAAELRAEPRLASFVVQQANYVVAASSPAKTLDQAVSRLGVDGLRVALIEFAARPVLESRHPRVEEAFRRPWPHAVAVGLVTQRIVQLRHPGKEANDAYLAGLLHDVGKPIAGAALADLERELATVRGRRWLKDDVWLACIEAARGRIGAALARTWQVPESAVTAIEASAGPDLAAGWSLGGALRLAEALAALEGFQLRREEITTAAAQAEEGRRRLGVDSALVTRAVHGIKERVPRRG